MCAQFIIFKSKVKLGTAQVVETSVTVNNSSPIQDYVQPDDHTRPTYEMMRRRVKGKLHDVVQIDVCRKRDSKSLLYVDLAKAKGAAFFYILIIYLNKK